MTGFARGVWWTGHAQLFVGAALIAVGPLSLLAAALIPHVPGTIMASGFAVLGWLGTAMSLPFVTSGLMMRAYGNAMNGVTRPLLWQIIELSLVVLGIAGLSIVFVFVLAFILVFTVMSALAG